MLPDFNRVTWVSDELRIKWERIITALPEIIDSIWSSKEIFDIVPIQIKSISISDLYNYKKRILSNGIFVEHINELPESIVLLFGLKKGVDKTFVIIGLRQNVIGFIKAIKDENYQHIVEYLPKEIFCYWEDYAKHDLIDDMWGRLNKTHDRIEQFSSFSNNLLNPCWKHMGISSIPYNPASLSCANSIELATVIQSCAKGKLSDELFNSWYEILSWPVEWSALHGIAEIKSPIFKMIYNTDPTGEKYVLQLESDTYPEDGLNGLLFPYKKPRRLFFTDSKQNASGIKHLSETLKEMNFKN